MVVEKVASVALLDPYLRVYFAHGRPKGQGFEVSFGRPQVVIQDARCYAREGNLEENMSHTSYEIIEQSRCYSF